MSSVVKLVQAYVSTGFGPLCVRVKEVNERCQKALSGERLPILLFLFYINFDGGGDTHDMTQERPSISPLEQRTV